MAQEKISFAQFLKAVDDGCKEFVEELHNFVTENGCKVKFEEKKSGFLASYKIGKPQRALMNFVFRKNCMLTRIYGERIGSYPDFLNTLPPAMVESIGKAGMCGRLVNNTCSPKCTGYDFMINGERYQKCRYSCFLFLITDESIPFIRQFVEHEINGRMAA